MNTPSDLRYTKEHEWVKIESDDVVVFGITDFNCILSCKMSDCFHSCVYDIVNAQS